MLETWNFKLFLMLNASSGLQGYALLFPLFLAKYGIVCVIVGLILCWFVATNNFRRTTFSAVITVLVSLLVNYVIGRLWFHPRPFMIPLGNTYLEHAPTSSFPSHHMTILWALAITYLMTERMRALGIILALFSLAVGWSRIYIGIHFPFDILGSILLSTLAAILVKKFELTINTRLFPSVEFISRKLFALIIHAKSS